MSYNLVTTVFWSIFSVSIMRVGKYDSETEGERETEQERHIK